MFGAAFFLGFLLCSDENSPALSLGDVCLCRRESGLCDKNSGRNLLLRCGVLYIFTMTNP